MRLTTLIQFYTQQDLFTWKVLFLFHLFQSKSVHVNHSCHLPLIQIHQQKIIGCWSFGARRIAIPCVYNETCYWMQENLSTDFIQVTHMHHACSLKTFSVLIATCDMRSSVQFSSCGILLILIIFNHSGFWWKIVIFCPVLATIESFNFRNFLHSNAIGDSRVFCVSSYIYQ